MNDSTIRTAVSQMKINAAKNAVWEKVGFYEHVKKTPTWLLKLSLPVPQEVEGSHRQVGDICRCKYSDGGYLTKKITRVVDNTRIEFDIIEQSIRYQHTIKLLGGSIEVVAVDGGSAIVNMVTYYENHIYPQTISSIFIEKIIKTMHQFVFSDMQAQLVPVGCPGLLSC